jgi:hypothetical protein
MTLTIHFNEVRTAVIKTLCKHVFPHSYLFNDKLWTNMLHLRTGAIDSCIQNVATECDDFQFAILMNLVEYKKQKKKDYQ